MAKRRAGNDLNRDNWDQEEEPEEIGCFKKASDDVLKGRVIRQARRRMPNTSSTPETEPKSIFSGFTAFSASNESNKFSFTADLKGSGDGNTNGQKPAFSFLSKSNHSETKPTLSFLSNAAVTSKKSESIGEKSPSSISDIFTSKNATNTSTSVADNTSPDGNKSTPLFSSTIPQKKSTETSDLVGKNKLNQLSKELVETEKQSTETAAESRDSQPKTPDEIFLQKLRSLNLLCTEWIIKHLNENLGYILTPIFDDYKKYLNQLKEERQRANSSTKKPKIVEPPADDGSKTETTKPPVSFKVPNFKATLSKQKPLRGFFAPSAKEEEKPTGFKFSNHAETVSNFKFSSSSPQTEITPVKSSEPSPGVDDTGIFKFGTAVKSTPTEGFSFGTPKTNESADPKNETPKIPSFFSFTPAPLTTNPLIGQTPAPATDRTNSKDEDEDAPPVPEDEVITEEGSVYDKKCKVFIKKDGNFVDLGVGFLFLKLVGDEQKCQIIVRANNKLANILINVLLTSGIPTQLMGKNNVMVICCPTPEAKPTTVLLRVKTAEDAQELLDTMNKYKKWRSC